MGTYTVGVGNSAKLSVSSLTFTAADGSTDSVSDLYGNPMQNTDVPSSGDIADNQNIIIDNTPPGPAH